MGRIAPRPIIAQVAQTWRLPTGLTFALVRDIEGETWIVESCPAGTRFWTPEQAAMLPHGRQTGSVLRAALRQASTWTADAPALPEPPVFDYTLTDAVQKLFEAPVAPERTQPSRRPHAAAKTPVCA